jgi:hypothetical protein
MFHVCSTYLYSSVKLAEPRRQVKSQRYAFFVLMSEYCVNSRTRHRSHRVHLAIKCFAAPNSPKYRPGRTDLLHEGLGPACSCVFLPFLFSKTCSVDTVRSCGKVCAFETAPVSVAPEPEPEPNVSCAFHLIVSEL